MSETKKMIEIINHNRSKVYETKKQINAQKKARREKISNVLAYFGYLIAFAAFVQVICLLVK